jgi:hypothetical protein
MSEKKKFMSYPKTVGIVQGSNGLFEKELCKKNTW